MLSISENNKNKFENIDLEIEKKNIFTFKKKKTIQKLFIKSSGKILENSFLLLDSKTNYYPEYWGIIQQYFHYNNIYILRHA